MTRRWPLVMASALLSLVAPAVLAQPAPNAPAEPAATGNVDAASIDAALAEIHDVDHWKQNPGAGDADDPLAQAFIRWTKLLTELSRSGQHEAADRICAAIVELHDRLPQDKVIAPSHTAANAFVRDRFRVGERHVDAAQFFAPEPYYPNDPSLTKLFRFSVYEGDKVVLRYYLEHSRFGDDDYYVLGKADPATRAHYQVQPYGAKAPSYWTLLDRVLADMSDHHPHYPASSGPSH
ncbi:MAG TPA: hypothetical protein VFB32_15115 [Rudaea sp.]|nr:hypothetical protein [Rudaea sp.]